MDRRPNPEVIFESVLSRQRRETSRSCTKSSKLDFYRRDNEDAWRTAVNAAWRDGSAVNVSVFRLWFIDLFAKENL